jgi:hypothetical protein
MSRNPQTAQFMEHLLALQREGFPLGLRSDLFIEHEIQDVEN